jgi:hypothetical protein
MITDKTIREVTVIFSDADIIDIDLSKWDESIGIYVIADHVKSPNPGRRAVVALDFRGVRRFDLSFSHHDFKQFPLKTSWQKHLNWPVYRSKIIRDQISQITISGSEQFPTLTIYFEEVEIRSVDIKLLDKMNPGWGKPSSGLARPSIETLSALSKHTRAPHRKRKNNDE